MTGGDGALSSTSDELRITTDFRAYPEAACSYCEAELDDVFLCLSVEDQSADVSREQMLQRTRAVFLTTDITDQVAESGGGFFNLSRLVHQAQGHLSLHSKANRTLLSIYLPEVRLRETVGGILVVDDEPQVSEYLKDILVRQGHRVTTRSNGIQALNLFKQNPGQFDLVITDQNMPGISIERIIREIHDVRPELPIIICSGYSASLTDVLAQKLGAAGFVKKPIDVGRLLSLVGSCISAVDRVKDGLVEYQS
jgi:CheY-like chemotaxis protein